MKRPRKAEPDEVMRTGHDLVMESRIQEAIEATGDWRAARRERGFDEVAPVAVDNRKIAQGFSGRERERARSSLAQSSSRRFCVSQPQIERLASCGIAKRPLPFLFSWMGQSKRSARIAPFLLCGERAVSASRNVTISQSRGLNAIFDMRLAPGRARGAFEDVAALVREVLPAIGERGTGRID